MKRHDLLLACCALALAAAPATADWAVRIGTGLAESVDAVTSTSDGGLLLGGNTRQPSPAGREAWFLRLDSEGEILWQAMLGLSSSASPNSDVVSWLGALEDGGFLFHGKNGDGSLWAGAFGADGELRWEMRGDLGASARATDGHGRFALANPTSDPVPNGRRVSTDLRVFDVEGRHLWSRSLGDGLLTVGEDPAGLSGPRMVLTADGGLVVASADALSRLRLARLDERGNLNWQRSLSGGAELRAGALIQLPNLSFVLAGTIADQAGGPGQPFLVGLSFDLRMTWQLRLDGLEGAEVNGLVLHGDGSLTLSGTHDSEPSWLARVELPGSILSAWAIDELGSATPHLARSSGDEVLVAGLQDGPFGEGDAFALSLSHQDDNLATCGVLSPILVQATAGTLTQPAEAPGGGTSELSTFVAAPYRDAVLRPALARAEPLCSALGCTADANEPSDLCSEGDRELEPHRPDGGNFCDDPEDWWSFQACAGDGLILDAEAIGLFADLQLEVHAPGCGPVIASGDGGPSQRAVFVAPSTGVYRIRVTQVDGTSGPDREYELRLSSTACTPESWSLRIDEATNIRDLGSDRSGGIVFCGGPHDGQAYVGSLAADGQLLWYRRLGLDEELDRLSAITVLDDGDLLAAGFTRDRVGRKRDLLLVRLAPIGTPRWSSRVAFGADGSSARLALVPLPDGRADVVGAFRPENGDWQSFMLRINPDGSIPQGRLLAPDDDDAMLHGAARRPDGGLLAVGWRGDTLLMALASDNSTLWSRRLDAGSAVGVDINAAGEALVATTGGSLLLVDADGELLGGRSFLWFDPGQVERRESSWLVAGRVDGDLALLALDDDLEPLWMNRWSVPTFQGISGLSVLSDGAILGAWGRLLRTDSAGRLPDSCLAEDRSRPWATATEIEMESSSEVSWRIAPFTERGVPESEALIPSVSVTCRAGSCLPLSAHIEGPDQVCGSSSALVTASATGHDSVIYEWDRDYDGVNFDVWQTGSSVWLSGAVGLQTFALRVRDGCLPERELIVLHEIDFQPGAPPVTAEMIEPITRCPQDPCALLRADAGFDSYLWSDGQTGRDVCVAPEWTTTYTVTAFIENGCFSEGSVVVPVHPMPRVRIREECRGGQPWLVAVDYGDATIQWSSGQIEPEIPVATFGTYGLQVRTADCVSLLTFGPVSPCLGPADPPGEVSGPAAIPLTVSGTGNVSRVRVEALSTATAHHVYIGAIGGDFLAKTGLNGSSCAVAEWTDEGDGSLSFDHPFEPGEWMLVSAANSLGEGPVGVASDGSSRAGSPLCGPSP